MMPNFSANTFICQGEDIRRTYLFPVPASHSWIPQSLDERDVGLEVLNLLLHFHGYFLAGRDLFEMFHTLEDSFEGTVDVLLQLFGVDCGQRIIHPAVIPLHPIRGCQPHVFERFKVLD